MWGSDNSASFSADNISRGDLSKSRGGLSTSSTSSATSSALPHVLLPPYGAMQQLRGCMGRAGRRVLIPTFVCLILLLTYREYLAASRRREGPITTGHASARRDTDYLSKLEGDNNVALLSREKGEEEEGDALDTDSQEIEKVGSELALPPQKAAAAAAAVQMNTPRIFIEDAKFIHIISYQRSGSSFIGKLFDIYEPAFFVYEPLEMLYTALYGVQEDNVVPHNIFFDHEAQFRHLSPPELKMSYWTMDQVFKCNMASFPTAMLINIFWAKFTKFMSSGIPFVQCLEGLGVNMTLGYDTLKQCQTHIRGVCAGTFTTLQEERLVRCNDVLHFGGEWQREVNPKAWKQYENTDFYNNRDKFQKYFDCLSQFEEGVKKCAAVHLDQECLKKSLRVIKTVRAPMELPEKFLSTYPNFRVMHLFRDPRGVTLSRMKADWSYSVFESNDPKILSQTYCRVILHEIAKRKRLESEYPNQVVSIIHDKVLEDIAQSTMDLFEALSLDYSDEVQEYVELHTKVTKRDRWRTTLRLQEIATIEGQCKELFQEAGFQKYVPNKQEVALREERRKTYLQQQRAKGKTS